MSLATHMSEMTPKLRPPHEAVDELEREMNVRLRCFPRWITEGRVSRTDAQDRLDRIFTAHKLLSNVLAAEQGSEQGKEKQS